MAKAAGCAAKLNPATLESVLRKLPRQTDPNVLVGFDTNDDAGVYRINDELALVQTVDFFTPIVDEPELFGAIAAANSLSDVRSEEHTSELQSPCNLVCRLLLEK